MWKALRSHPWRLEIVPAAAFAVVIWSVWTYQCRVVGYCAALAVNDGLRAAFDRLPVWALGMTFAFWLFEIGSNRDWVRAEREKRFNWPVLISHAVILLYAWTAFEAVSLIRALMTRASHVLFDWRPLLIGLVLGLGVTVLLEWTRRPIPPEMRHEPPAPAHSGLPYRETEVGWWFLSGAAVLAVACLLSCLHRLDIVTLVLGLAVLPVIGWSARRVVTVTDDALILSASIIRKRFPIREIESCAPALHQPLSNARKQGLWALSVMEGRCVEIRMTDGKVYRVGALRPEHICTLIQSAQRRPTAPHGGLPAPS